MITAHDNALDAVRKFRYATTAPVIQSETNPRLSYASLLSCLNDLSRSGKVKEGRNEIGKRVFYVE